MLALELGDAGHQRLDQRGGRRLELVVALRLRDVKFAAQTGILGDQLANEGLTATEKFLEGGVAPGLWLALSRVLHTHRGEDNTPAGRRTATRGRRPRTKTRERGAQRSLA